MLAVGDHGGFVNDEDSILRLVGAEPDSGVSAVDFGMVYSPVDCGGGAARHITGDFRSPAGGREHHGLDPALGESLDKSRHNAGLSSAGIPVEDKHIAPHT